jgi:cytochrome c2
MRVHFVWKGFGILVLLGFVAALTWEPGYGRQSPVWTVPDGDQRRGRQAILKYGCHACHVISSIREATGRVGPKLEEIGDQIYIGGVLPNHPENMIRWIQNPKNFSPETAMPDLGVTEQDARDIADYLYRNP